MSGKLTTRCVGWVEGSETQHQLYIFLSFTCLKPTYTDAMFIMGNQ